MRSLTRSIFLDEEYSTQAALKEQYSPSWNSYHGTVFPR